MEVKKGERQINIGDTVRHKKDEYTGRVEKIDNIFIHLDNGRHILKQYAEIIKESEDKQ